MPCGCCVTTGLRRTLLTCAATAAEWLNLYSLFHPKVRKLPHDIANEVLYLWCAASHRTGGKGPPRWEPSLGFPWSPSHTTAGPRPPHLQRRIPHVPTGARCSANSLESQMPVLCSW